MKIIKKLKNRKIIKRIFNKKKKDNILAQEITTEKIINNEIISDKVDNIILSIPTNETIINNKETFLIDSKENFSDTRDDLSNPINHIHNEGQCVCLIFILLFYYGSIIFTKIKKGINNI